MDGAQALLYTAITRGSKPPLYKCRSIWENCLNMKKLNRVFLILYLLILMCFWGLTAFRLYRPNEDPFFYILLTIILFVVTVFSQFIFIISTGRIDLQRPKHKFLVIIPIAMAAIMMAFLVYGFLAAAIEFGNNSITEKRFNDMGFAWPVIVLWILWRILFLPLVINKDKYSIFRNLISTLIAGSLLELLPAVFMHLTVSKRGCFAGISTGMGVAFGLVVMVWSFGPGVILLFIREKYKAELREKTKNKEQKPL